MTADGNPHRYDEFVDLFSGNARRIYGYVYTMLPRWADADDVFQETSRVLWQKFGEYESGTNFFAWARQVAHYQVLFFRQRQQRSRVKFTDAFLDAVAATAHEQSDRLESEQRALAECMDKLKVRERDLILSRFAPEATTKSVAARLGMTTAAVYKSLSRIQATLLKCIEQAIHEPKKGTGPICRNGPKGASHKLDLSPFSAHEREERG
jgi:RNA polymerase sigma-70 factor, ECF subfamily